MFNLAEEAIDCKLPSRPDRKEWVGKCRVHPVEKIEMKDKVDKYGNMAILLEWKEYSDEINKGVKNILVD